MTEEQIPNPITEEHLLNFITVLEKSPTKAILLITIHIDTINKFLDENRNTEFVNRLYTYLKNYADWSLLPKNPITTLYKRLKNNIKD